MTIYVHKDPSGRWRYNTPDGEASHFCGTEIALYGLLKLLFPQTHIVIERKAGEHAYNF